jgi:thioredoxin-related protein
MSFSKVSCFIKAIVKSLPLFTLSVSAQSIYQIPMVALNPDSNIYHEVQTLSGYQNKPLIITFFAPNCRWCQRQHKALKKISLACPETSIVFLGVQGNKANLRQELRRKKNTFPAFVADHKIVNLIGSESPVPMTLLFKKTGELSLKTIGYLRADDLVELLKYHGVANCISRTSE